MVPTIVISDGILKRLTPRECDAVIAHELAHLANGTGWILLSITSFSAFLATAVSQFVPLEVAAFNFFAIWVGSYRIAQRMLEVDCDRRAGQAVGFREMASTLVSLRVGYAVASSGWLDRLTDAAATHPHDNVRLVCLKRFEHFEPLTVR